MMSLPRCARLLLPCAMSATAASAAAPQAAPRPQIEVTGAKFLSLMQRPDGQYDAKDSTVLARVPDYSCYFWELSFRKKKGEAELTEEVIVPTMASGPTTARLRLPVDLTTGKIVYRRCVSRDDPAGAYKLNLLEGDHVLKSFDFSVEEPKE